jgi:outer membrane protein OmpA-like peptidoglycan-associated protein
MPRQTSAGSISRSGFLAVALAVLPACAPLQPPPPALASPHPTVSTLRYNHTVAFPTDGVEPTPAETAKLRSFLAGLPVSRRMSARVLGHADSRAADTYNADLSARRAERVADLVRVHGVGEVEVATAAFGETMPLDPGAGAAAWTRNRRVEVTVTGQEVILPGCPDWSRDPGFDPRNLPLSNLGCANAINLGLMIADPGDLAPRPEFAPADGTREAEAIVRYRTDKVQQLEADIIQ